MHYSSITPRQIQLAIRNDEELSKLMGKITVAAGGVLPCATDAAERERQRKAAEEEAKCKEAETAKRTAEELAAVLSVGLRLNYAELERATVGWTAKLGEGAFGTVYKAKSLKGVTGEAAVKLLKPGAAARSELEAEAAVAKALPGCEYLLPLLGTVRSAQHLPMSYTHHFLSRALTSRTRSAPSTR